MQAVTPIASVLKSLALKAVKEDLSREDRDTLETFLDAMLGQGAEFELAVLEKVLSGLQDDLEARDIFIQEVELHAELAPVASERDHKALLIALPVAFVAGDSFRDLARSTDDMTGIAQILQDAGVLDPDARVSFAPRLFAAQELVGQSYGGVFRITRALADQLAEGDAVRMMPGLMDVPAKLEHFVWGENPHIVLRFLVGVAVTHQDALPYLLSDELDDDDGQQEAMAVRDAARTAMHADESQGLDPSQFVPFDDEQGAIRLAWQKAICEEISDAFFSMQGCQNVAEPFEFHEALRAGLEFGRELGLVLQADMGFDEKEEILVFAQAAEELGVLGWDITLTGEDGSTRAIAPWEILNHESVEEGEEMLQAFCEDMGWNLHEIEPLQMA